MNKKTTDDADVEQIFFAWRQGNCHPDQSTSPCVKICGICEICVKKNRRRLTGFRGFKKWIVYRDSVNYIRKLSFLLLQFTFSVHDDFGLGLLENVYESALCIDYILAGIPYERQRACSVGMETVC